MFVENIESFFTEISFNTEYLIDGQCPFVLFSSYFDTLKYMIRRCVNDCWRKKPTISNDKS